MTIIAQKKQSCKKERSSSWLYILMINEKAGIASSGIPIGPGKASPPASEVSN